METPQTLGLWEDFHNLVIFYNNEISRDSWIYLDSSVVIKAGHLKLSSLYEINTIYPVKRVGKKLR